MTFSLSYNFDTFVCLLEWNKWKRWLKDYSATDCRIKYVTSYRILLNSWRIIGIWLFNWDNCNWVTLLQPSAAGLMAAWNRQTMTIVCLLASSLAHSPGDSLDLLAALVVALTAPYTPVVLFKDVRTPDSLSVDSNGFIKRHWAEGTVKRAHNWARLYGQWLLKTAGVPCFASNYTAINLVCFSTVFYLQTVFHLFLASLLQVIIFILIVCLFFFLFLQPFFF